MMCEQSEFFRFLGILRDDVVEGICPYRSGEPYGMSLRVSYKPKLFYKTGSAKIFIHARFRAF